MEINTILQSPKSQSEIVNGKQDAGKNQSRERLETDKKSGTQQPDTVELRVKPSFDEQPDMDIEQIENDYEALSLSQQAGQSLFGLLSSGTGITTQGGSELIRSL